jgi:ATP-dependent exoDNAse (exonuclease V) beta subunit
MDEGKATSISIIDFKTDAKETAESLRTKHTPQLHIYRAALHRITGVPLDEIRCYLLATELRQMVEID